MLAVMARDKKALAGLTFVLDGTGGGGHGVEVVSDVDPETVRAVLETVR